MINIAFRLFAQELRAGKLWILLMAIIIAVSAISSVNFYLDRVGRALNMQAAELLGGDLLLSSPTPIPDDWKIFAKNLSLKSTEVLLFPSVISANGQFQLVSIKAINQGYPLTGELRIAQENPSLDKATQEIPKPGSVWVDVRVLNLLNIKLGEIVKIGAKNFQITQILTYEPDAESNWFNIAPRVLMNEGDIQYTQIIQPGSRVEYRFLMMGNEKSLQNFSEWIEPKLNSSQKLLTVKKGRPELRNALLNTDRYLHLGTLLCVILAGVAIAASARHYSRRHFDLVAIMRCYGATQFKILLIYNLQLFILGVIASIIGCLIGFLGQNILVAIFSHWLNIVLPAPSFWPVILGFISGLILLLGFAVPPISALRRVTPIQILKRQQQSDLINQWTMYSLAILSIVSLLLWQTKDTNLTLIILYSLVASLSVLYGMSLLIIKLTHYLRNRVGVTWRYGLANIARHSDSSTIQVLVFGLIMIVILLLLFMRNNLIESWKNQLPKNSPNYFLINIQPNDIPALQALLKQYHVRASGLYPMVRGRMIELNGKPILDVVPLQSRGHNALNRELNLTWTSNLPSDNRIIAGSWWKQKDRDKKLISLEAKLAEDLGIHLNDQISFQVGDQVITAIVYNLRTVEWDSFHPNFYVIFPEGVLEDFPSTGITSFYLTPNQNTLLTELVSKFPSVTIMDLHKLLLQVRSMIDRLILAVEFLLIFTLIAAFIVMFAVLQISQDDRRYEVAILKALGASRSQIQKSLMAEFITLGLIAGILAALSASIITWILTEKIFHIQYHLEIPLALIGILGSTLLIAAGGWLATKSTYNQSTIRLLQEDI